MSTDLDAAWDAVHDAKPDRWYVGRPTDYGTGRGWVMYAFDRTERAVMGHRSGEWMAVGASELEVVRQMARCLAIIREGGTPT